MAQKAHPISLFGLWMEEVASQLPNNTNGVRVAISSDGGTLATVYKGSVQGFLDLTNDPGSIQIAAAQRVVVRITPYQSEGCSGAVSATPLQRTFAVEAMVPAGAAVDAKAHLLMREAREDQRILRQMQTELLRNTQGDNKRLREELDERRTEERRLREELATLREALAKRPSQELERSQAALLAALAPHVGPAVGDLRRSLRVWLANVSPEDSSKMAAMVAQDGSGALFINLLAGQVKTSRLVAFIQEAADELEASAKPIPS